MIKIFILCQIAAAVLLAACSKSDPILPGARTPVFKQDEIVVIDEKIESFGEPVQQQKCEFSIDGNNMIWKDGVRIFAGLPTESEISSKKQTLCRGGFVYAGLTTGELVKVDVKKRDLEWAADIFAERTPTNASPFLDIIAAPVYNNGYIYAGGLGDAFCKIRDRDGEKIWCLPISVQAIILSTKTFNVVQAVDGKTYAVSVDGKVYKH